MGRFQEALVLTLRFEGGFSDHPSDPGGRTMRGVTERVYHAWLRGQGLPLRPVRDIKEWELEGIYSGRYWNPSRAAELPAPADLLQFDCAVNCGVGRAVRLLQSAAGTDVDGAFGPMTRAAVREADPHWLADAMLWEREQHYRRITGENQDLLAFLRGWLWRIETLRWAPEVALPGRGSWLRAA